MIDLTIIMLTYNHEKFIKTAIESILEQVTNYKYEILIGDDFSKDSTAKIIEEYQNLYPNKIRFIKRDKNIGASKNLYDLLSKSRGRYIAYLEGDDFWNDKNKIQKQINLLDSNDYIGVAHANYRVDMDGNNFGETCYFSKAKVININNLLKTSVGLFHTATFMHKNIFLNSQINYNIIFEAHSLIADYTIACLCLDKGSVLYIPDRMSSYRENTSSIGENASAIIRRNMSNQYYEIISMYSKLDNYFDNKYSFNYAKSVRVLELLSSYFIKKNIKTKEILEFWRKLSFKVKVISTYLFIKKSILYFNRKIFSIISNKS